jgi:hypothetical protein
MPLPRCVKLLQVRVIKVSCPCPFAVALVVASFGAPVSPLEAVPAVASSVLAAVIVAVAEIRAEISYSAAEPADVPPVTPPVTVVTLVAVRSGYLSAVVPYVVAARRVVARPPV